MNQAILLENILDFRNKSRPRSNKDKEKKQNTLDNINALYEGRELILNAFGSGIFPMKEKQGKGLNILTPKQMHQRLPIALAQEKHVMHPRTYQMKSGKSYIICLEQEKLLKKCAAI